MQSLNPISVCWTYNMLSKKIIKPECTWVEWQGRKVLINCQQEVLPPRRVPYDVWELLSNYILPCSVGKFAAICKDSYAVTQRPHFWLKLYRDFYHFGCEVPNSLRPEAVMFPPRGLRWRRNKLNLLDRSAFMLDSWALLKMITAQTKFGHFWKSGVSWLYSQ